MKRVIAIIITIILSTILTVFIISKFYSHSYIKPQQNILKNNFKYIFRNDEGKETREYYQDEVAGEIGKGVLQIYCDNNEKAEYKVTDTTDYAVVTTCKIEGKRDVSVAISTVDGRILHIWQE